MIFPQLYYEREVYSLQKGAISLLKKSCISSQSQILQNTTEQENIICQVNIF